MKTIMEILREARLEEMRELDNMDSDTRALYNKQGELFEKVSEKLNDYELMNEFEEAMAALTSIEQRKYYEQGYKDGSGK